MSFENLNLKINAENIITSTLYHNFTVIDKEPEVGDFVIPIANLGGKYLNTIQANNWFGLVWNLQDDSMGRIYLVDQFDSYNLNLDEVVVVTPTEKDILKFIDRFLDGSANDSAIDVCFNLLKEHHPTFKTKLDNIFPTCPLCGCRLNRRNSKHTDDEGNICSDCYRKLYRDCRKCGHSFKRDSITSTEELCTRCQKRRFILPYHKWYPVVKFYGKDHEKTVPYLGIELEIDDGGQRDENAAIAMDIINKDDDIFMYCSSDSSISDGFEMITQPATLEYHNSIKGIYSNMFTRLVKLNYCSHDTSTCGMHVHFNRDYYADNEEVYITRLLYLIEKFWDNIIIFSRRNERRLDHFAKKVDRPLAVYYQEANKSGNHNDHYYSINIANENTIEFRMFKGTMNINTFFATLQFVNNCIVAAKEKTTAEVQAMVFKDLITTREMKKYWKRRCELATMPNEE